MSDNDVRTVVVCVPAAAAAPDLLEVADARLAALGLCTQGPVDHFVTLPAPVRRGLVRRSRRRSPALTFGGPIRQLDLAGMRDAAAAGAAGRWQLWQRVVARTAPARPYWFFEDKHWEDAERWPLGKVRDAFAGQPRCQAMAVYNATVDPAAGLPVEYLEAFQAGEDAYMRLGGLAAVPGDAFAAMVPDPVAVTAGTSGWYTPASGRLNDLVAYLTATNRLLNSLHPDTQLAAVTAS
ncbi:hypothetical protein [Phytohabitans houttuyneae]|uniref:Uncharacterized protein n=1 Tax=Phytohabitans houttuyneae TaxID=1076126 RepID=A0A6V8K554_9ACTN|nr:hypothetical protein [Phytohabitans houttuyneae]GFJ77448.1 hypothetical protein Phou_016280 [Phytohabitans houttuyneae]